MEHKLIYDDEHDFLRATFIGSVTKKDALEIAHIAPGILAGKTGKQMLVDLLKFTDLEDRETRSLLNKALKDNGIEDVSYHGASAAARMIAKVLMKLGGLELNSNFFKTEADAIKWLINRRKKK